MTRTLTSKVSKIFCEAQVRVRQGSARDGPQVERTNFSFLAQIESTFFSKMGLGVLMAVITLDFNLNEFLSDAAQFCQPSISAQLSSAHIINQQILSPLF